MKEYTIAVIDIETTDFLRYGGLIVEVGIVELNLRDGSTNIIYNEIVKEESFCHNHRNSWIFNNSTLKFDSILNGNPLDTNTIQNFIDEYNVTAYNKAFDFEFLNSRGVSIKNELDCPMLLMTPICKIPPKTVITGRVKDYKWPSFQECWDFIFPNSGYREAHRAADDAKHEAIVVYELVKRGILKIK